jgi:cell division septum initiation protein DivIVA
MEREYRNMEQEKARLEAELAARPDPSAISRALVDAEALAKRIKDRAQIQADDTLREARSEAEKSILNARLEAGRVLSARDTVEKLLRDLFSELDKPGKWNGQP